MQTFEQFMAKADRVIQRASGCGMGIHDLADAAWWDLWEESEDHNPSDAAIIETLADADMIFAAMAELNGAIQD